MNYTIISNKYYNEASIFLPENLLREAKRQKNLPDCKVPSICLLDPDGDILEYLQRTGKAHLNDCWACYHTNLYSFTLKELEVGIVACAVGASFSVLIAEQLFVSGCEILFSVTSSGIINKVNDKVDYILIDEAVRDEGTSYHYLPPGECSYIQKDLLAVMKRSLLKEAPFVTAGKSWTTDAPYRETPSAIENMKFANVHVVEMEAAALYAFATAKNKKVICFAHITNSMAQIEVDFEKGLENGSISSLEIVYRAAKDLLRPGSENRI